MKKFLTALLVAALGVGVFGVASAELGWKTVPITIQTNKAASVNQADNDSGPTRGTANSGFAANTPDTSYAFGPVFPLIAPDSLQFVVVAVKFASAIASGESLYTVLQGSADGGQTWVNLNIGGISIGGSLTGQVASGVVRLASTPTSATNVAAKSPGALPFFYSGWFGFPTLRIIFNSDKSAAMVANTYQAWATFPTVIR